MKKLGSRFYTDISSLFLLILMFVAMFYFSFGSASLEFNYIMLLISGVLMLVASFVSAFVTLILCGAFVLLIIIYTVYSAIHTGASPDWNIYFWMLWTPLTAGAVSSFTIRTNHLQKENVVINQRLLDQVTVDEKTGLKNLRAYTNDIQVYLNISTRYQLHLAVAVWEFRQQDWILSMIGPNALEALILKISQALQSTLRSEDAIYFIDDHPSTWATMFLMNQQATEQVVARIRQAVDTIDLSEFFQGKPPFSLDLAVAVRQYDQGKQISAFALLNELKIELREKKDDLV